MNEDEFRNTLAPTVKQHNRGKILVARQCGYTLSFEAVIGFTGLQIFEFLGSATGPFHRHMFDCIGLAQPERQGKFRL